MVPKCLKCESENFILVPHTIGNAQFTSVCCSVCNSLITVLDGVITMNKFDNSTLTIVRTIQNNIDELTKLLKEIKKKTDEL